MRLNIQFFGGRGSAGGNAKGQAESTVAAAANKTATLTKSAESQPTAEKKAPERTKKTPEEKAQAFMEKVSNLKSTMTQEQFNKKWSGMIKNAPVGSRIVLEGRTWENNKDQNIWIYKTSPKTYSIQFGNGAAKERKTSEGLGNILSNYYVGKAEISVEDKNEHWGRRTLKRINLKKG